MISYMAAEESDLISEINARIRETLLRIREAGEKADSLVVSSDGTAE